MAFYKPWTGPNRTAYHAADTLDDIIEGRKRCRTTVTVLVPMAAVEGMKCLSCGRELADKYEVNPGKKDWHRDERARVEHNPKRRTIGGMHYYCGWGVLMQKVLDHGRLIGY